MTVEAFWKPIIICNEDAGVTLCHRVTQINLWNIVEWCIIHKLSDILLFLHCCSRLRIPVESVYHVDAFMVSFHSKVFLHCMHCIKQAMLMLSEEFSPV